MIDDAARHAAGRRLVAITHRPSPKMQEYEHSYVDEQAIDLAVAEAQHAGYCAALAACGADVVLLDVNREMPDCVFVEDTAIVLDELAVMMSPGAVSRRGEPAGIEPELAKYRRIERVLLPGTIDGGDVVVCGRALYVGASARTNEAGIGQLRAILQPFGYTVTSVPVTGCLHLKTACSALPDGRFLVNPEWIDVSPLPASRLVPVPASEPWAGDVLVIGDQIIVSDAFPATIEMLDREGWMIRPVAVSEFAKAEGGVTCLSLVFAADPSAADAGSSDA